MKKFTPTLPASGMSVQLAAKAALLNVIALHASIRCFSTNAGGEAKYWLSLKRGGNNIHNPHSIPSRTRVGVKMGVGVQCHQLATITFKALTSLLIGLFISTLPVQGQAETTGQFGRLFSKPSERANLDVLRKSQQLKVITPKDQQASEDGEESEPLALLDPITLQGYVKRSDGASTLWVNNQAVQEDSTVDNATIGRLNKGGFSSKGDSTEGVDVKMPASGKHIRLKAGQMYEPASNQIVELQVVEKAKGLSLEETGVIDGDAQPSVSKAGSQVE